MRIKRLAFDIVPEFYHESQDSAEIKRNMSLCELPNLNVNMNLDQLLRLIPDVM
jgi:hypothetical protein